MGDEGSRRGELRQRIRSSPESPDVRRREDTTDENAALRSKCLTFQIFVGCLVTVTIGMMYAFYLLTFHERKVWFSSRMDIDQEITFQGDGAIYYSFYKDLLRAPSFEKGIKELIYNNKTVPMKTVNFLKQLTLYPEIFASAMLQIVGRQGVDPAFLYLGLVFGLQAIYIGALFAISWLLSGTWLSGVLAATWFISNRIDATRIEDSIPLRENWALPYFACQVAALTGYIRHNSNSSVEKFSFMLMCTTTYTFMVVWEYSHYLLFVQALSLCLLDGLSLINKEKMGEIRILYLASVSLGYLVQFQNTALLKSPLFSLVLGSITAKVLQARAREGSFQATALKTMTVYVTLAFAVTLHFLIGNKVSHVEKDQILKTVEAKLGLTMTKNFTMNWLLCQRSFQPPSHDYLIRITQTSLLPFYILVLTICMGSIAQGLYNRILGNPAPRNPEEGRIGDRPEVIYHVIQSLILGLMAMNFEGLKYIWTPYVCVIAAFGVCSPALWLTVIRWSRLKAVPPVMLAFVLSAVVPAVIGFNLWREFLPSIGGELSDLEEHFESDTAEVMNWITTQAPVTAVFAGSPQLLGAIKLSTGWMVTSLPVYNDGELIKRNEDMFQIYSMRSPEEIYKTLLSYQARYMVIEESICNEMVRMDNCRVKDLLDIANGHMVIKDGDVYAYSKYGRFCHELKLNRSPHMNYFTRVYWNRSYFIYKINTVLSFQS